MVCLWTLLIGLFAVAVAAQKKCPPQEAILPCRCLAKAREFQIWCSHSDLPNVLEGLKSIGQFLQEPIDELILENNYLPSLPGRTFLPLNVLRLMLRYNGLERVSSDWLVGLESSLMELFVVEPDLRSLPDDSLIHLNNLEAITIQTNLMKRLPLFSGLLKLRYLQLESLSLLELSPRILKDLPSLETVHINKSPRLTRLEGGFLQDLPRLVLVNISYCGIDWMHPRAISRLPKLKELSLIGNKIDDVGMVGRATRDLPQLEILRLDHNLIDKISEASFVDLPSLKRLYLSNNHITELQYGAFHRVPLLRTLDLNRNNVRRIHPESFLQHSGSGLEELWLIENDIGHVDELRSLLDALPRLTFLDLSWNNLEAIPFGSIRGHPTLERLHLDFNKIHLIDREGFMAMPALRELRLKNNSLTDLLEGPFWNLPALKGLDLSGNFFRRLEPMLLANLPSLRRVDFSQNDLTIIDPVAFLMTPKLEHVNLSRNHLTSLHPATFRHLLSLYELDVSHNELLEFVPNLPRGLEYLIMKNNRISEIPEPPSVDLDLPSLRMIDVGFNSISRINANSFRSVPQLRRLYLRSNNLQKLDEGSLMGLSRLEILDLQDNTINQIHPNSLSEMIELRDLNLRHNRLDILFPEIFKNMPRLKYLDVSRNKIGEILPQTLQNNREMRKIDASYNYLVKLPPNLIDMKNLSILDLSHNRLKNFNTLSALTSLAELKLSQNFIQELRKGAFDNLQHLRALHLDNNELEVVESNAIRSLPVLKTLKLSKNKLKEIPNYAFTNLPTLQVAELQNNMITGLGNEAFHMVPHLLMLNLSHNHLRSIEDAGLRSLKSLELLDVSENKINRVTGYGLAKMEWLVELRMDDNDICAVHGSPFDEMPRLRVLTMRNNKMMSLPEQSMQKLRGNIAVLDIDGNPLACTCGLLWLQAWLHEGSSMGPKCVDGSLLREMRLSRQDCPQEERNVELVAPGCEAELLSAPGTFGTSQVFAHHQWMNLKNSSNNRKGVSKNNLAPSPEESEYFYDEYVDYPYNDTNNDEKKEMTTIKVDLLAPLNKSPHYTSGDTPTIYAASNNNRTKPDIPKEIANSPSTSGFTFFGVPLPSLGLNNIFGGGATTNGRTSDKKPPVIPIADRKSAIVNKPQRNGGRGGVLPPPPVYDMRPPPPPNRPGEEGVAMLPPPLVPPHLMRGPPNLPQVQTGGFVPLLPGSGGFKPIANPNNFGNEKNISVTVTEVEVIPSVATAAVTESSDLFIRKGIEVGGGHPIPTPPVMSTTTPATISGDSLPASQNVSVLLQFQDDAIIVTEDGVTIAEVITAKPDEKSKFPEIVTESMNLRDVDDSPSKNAEEFIGTTTTTNEPSTTQEIMQTSTELVTTVLLPTSSDGDYSEILGVSTVNEGRRAATPLSALLVPGGQQPEFRPSGRPTITKVQSPHVSGSSPLQATPQIEKVLDPLPHNREPKQRKNQPPKDEFRENVNDETNWYFANYNKTNLDPYIGTDPPKISSSFKNAFSYVFLIITSLLVFL